MKRMLVIIMLLLSLSYSLMGEVIDVNRKSTIRLENGAYLKIYSYRDTQSGLVWVDVKLLAGKQVIKRKYRVDADTLRINIDGYEFAIYDFKVGGEDVAYHESRDAMTFKIDIDGSPTTELTSEGVGECMIIASIVLMIAMVVITRGIIMKQKETHARELDALRSKIDQERKNHERELDALRSKIDQDRKALEREKEKFKSERQSLIDEMHLSKETLSDLKKKIEIEKGVLERLKNMKL